LFHFLFDKSKKVKEGVIISRWTGKNLN